MLVSANMTHVNSTTVAANYFFCGWPGSPRENTELKQEGILAKLFILAENYCPLERLR